MFILETRWEMVKIYDQNNKDVREQGTVGLMLYIMFTNKYKIE